MSLLAAVLHSGVFQALCCLVLIACGAALIGNGEDVVDSPRGRNRNGGPQ